VLTAVLAGTWISYVRAGEAKKGRVRIEAAEFKSHVLLEVPKSYKAEKKWPLLVSLHGAGGSAENFIRVWADAAPKAGYILLVPHGDASVPEWKDTQRTWSGISPKYILWAIEEVQNRYEIDADRIYLHGFSAGGHMTFYTGLLNHDLFAAIVPVSGCIQQRMHKPGEIEKAIHLPVRAVVGTKDMNHTPVVQSVDFLKKQGFKTVLLEEYPGLGHQYPMKENPKILKWFEGLYQERLKAKGLAKHVEAGEKALDAPEEGHFPGNQGPHCREGRGASEAGQ
jgi:predicted esterase